MAKCAQKQLQDAFRPDPSRGVGEACTPTRSIGSPARAPSRCSDEREFVPPPSRSPPPHPAPLSSPIPVCSLFATPLLQTACAFGHRGTVLGPSEGP
eukprot:6347425-Alexandrium_andersonii.AAC.1